MRATPRAKVEAVKREIMRQPVFNSLAIGAAYKLGGSAMDRIIRLLKDENGYDAIEIRKRFVVEYFREHIGATCKQAATYFNVNVATINAVLSCCRKDDNMDDDDVLFSRRCIRPEWYVIEFTEKGYLGISLPDDNFARYLEIYETKKAHPLLEI